MTTRFKFTRASVDAATCPPGKSQVIYWDTEQPGLGLRVTPSGARAFIFEGWLGGKSLRVKIGPGSMQLRGVKDRQGRIQTPGADTEARRMKALVNQGIDPRAEKAEKVAAQATDRAAQAAERAMREVAGLDAWGVYVEARRPKWGDRHYSDHLKMAAAGGAERKRSREKVTQPGPLRALLALPLARIDAQAVEAWLRSETQTRPGRAALAFRHLIVFFNWCAEHPDYSGIVQADACKSKSVREEVAKPAAKDDALQREQLRAWFAEVRKLQPTQAAYLQALLLTGARREELAGLRWEDVDFRWQSLRIRDKVEGERTIPLTRYVAGLLGELKARNETPPPQWRILHGRRVANDLEGWAPSPWVFASKTAADGRMQEPRIAHNRALAAAALPHVTLHGLRRSFGTLSEWVECPVGVVAQIQGHKPSAIAEKHYRVRPLDLLRLWHQRIEDWILTEAGIDAHKAEDAEGIKPAPALAVVA